MNSSSKTNAKWRGLFFVQLQTRWYKAQRRKPGFQRRACEGNQVQAPAGLAFSQEIFPGRCLQTLENFYFISYFLSTTLIKTNKQLRKARLLLERLLGLVSRKHSSSSAVLILYCRRQHLINKTMTACWVGFPPHFFQPPPPRRHCDCDSKPHSLILAWFLFRR